MNNKQVKAATHGGYTPQPAQYNPAFDWLDHECIEIERAARAKRKAQLKALTINEEQILVVEEWTPLPLSKGVPLAKPKRPKT
jgi:hypothetical protein